MSGRRTPADYDHPGVDTGVVSVHDLSVKNTYNMAYGHDLDPHGAIPPYCIGNNTYTPNYPAIPRAADSFAPNVTGAPRIRRSPATTHQYGRAMQGNFSPGGSGRHTRSSARTLRKAQLHSACERFGSSLFCPEPLISGRVDFIISHGRDG